MVAAASFGEKPHHILESLGTRSIDVAGRGVHVNSVDVIEQTDLEVKSSGSGLSEISFAFRFGIVLPTTIRIPFKKMQILENI
jgi:hypothetical protein